MAKQGSPPSDIGNRSPLWLSKVLLPRTYVTVAHCGYACLGLLVFFLPKIIKIFGFQIFWLFAFLMEVIPEVRRVHFWNVRSYYPLFNFSLTFRYVQAFLMVCNRKTTHLTINRTFESFYFFMFSIYIKLLLSFLLRNSKNIYLKF